MDSAAPTLASRRLQALYLLALARNFYPAHHGRIVLQLGSLDALLDAPEPEIKALELTGGQITRLLDVRAGCDPAAELAKLAEQGIHAVAYGEPDYPDLLAQVSDAPLLLFCRGEVEMMRNGGVAIVGSRKCSEVGQRIARDFGRDLAGLGVPVLSGMAAGIDGAAHEGALDAGGPTVAVLGCGIDVVYPPDHHQLYAELCDRALVVSEYPPGTEPRKEHFPQRNRIISGLARGVLVVEAGMGSGALITARLALEHGREVFAVPGPISSPYTKGTHHLIKAGQAKLAENVNDILVEFGTNKAALAKERYAPKLPLEEAGAARHGLGPKDGRAAGAPKIQDALSPAEQLALEAISYEGSHVNDVVRKLGITTSECIAHLTMLEIRGLICASSGGYYVRL